MKQNAIHEALLRLEKASKSIDSMPTFPQFNDYKMAWFDFLSAAEGVYSKIGSGARGNQKSSTWVTRKRREQKADPLLWYLKQARNSEEHSLGTSLRYQAGTISYYAKKPGAKIGFQQDFSATPFRSHVSPLKITENDGFEVHCVPAKAHLIAVYNDRFKDWTHPPANHLGEPIKDLTPIGVGKLGLEYLHSMVGEAQALVPSFKRPFQ